MADNDQSLYNLRYNQVENQMEGFGGGTPQWTPLSISSGGTPAGQDRDIQINNDGAFGVADDFFISADEGLLNLPAGLTGNSDEIRLVSKDAGYINFKFERSSGDVQAYFGWEGGDNVLRMLSNTDIRFQTDLNGNGYITTLTRVGSVQMPVTSDPATPQEGEIWYDNNTHSWRGYNGTAFGTFTWVADV